MDENTTLVMRMAKFKIGEFVEVDVALEGVRWQKWTALLNDNLEYFGITEPGEKVKALRIYGVERIRELVDNLPDPVLHGRRSARICRNYG